MALVVRHVTRTDPPQFQLVFGADFAPPVAIPPPETVPVAGDITLTAELTWYLEKFLHYPFPPETDRAERFQAALKKWGAAAFDALFATRDGTPLFDAAKKTGYDQLLLQVTSDDPRILAWPWEALHDPRAGWLVLTSPIERRLVTPGEPAPVPAALPRDRVNVLLVIARPYENDVKFHSIARPLVELAESEQLPVEIHVLRPPTLAGLKQHLETRKGYYHILHFDGHGAYRADPVAAPSGYTYRAPQGRLVFEKEDGSEDPIEAEKLVETLREYGIPVAVLNACQAGMITAAAEDPFASVAAALLKAGLRSVVAMSHVLYVSAAQQFIPAFYRTLFRAGSLPQAVRAGRRQLRDEPGRVCSAGTHPLDDWLIPVLYQQADLPLSFAATARADAKRETRIPDEARDDRNLYRFIGRDEPILALERALRGKPAGVLVTGLGGVGKTTLVKGFLKWLEQTQGLDAPPLWFSFEGLRSADSVLNRTGEAVFGNTAFATLPGPQKVERLARAIRDQRLLIVWDNFETAKGVPGSGRPGLLSAGDCTLLRDFLDQLRGGKAKVLITSRSTEDWLGPTNRGKPIALGGLDGEERWQFANAILSDLGVKADRRNAALVELMDLLQGHPLAMRAMLSKLGPRTVRQLIDAVTKNTAALTSTAADANEARLFATLRFVTDELPDAWKPLLVPLGLHAGFVQGDFLEAMSAHCPGDWPRAVIDDFLRGLVTAGLLHDTGQSIYRLHPLLTGYLRSTAGTWETGEVREPWVAGFVDIMGRVADQLAPQPWHKQRAFFFWHAENFQTARDEAKRLAMPQDFAALTWSLASYAENTRDWGTAERLYAEYAEHQLRLGEEKKAAGGYHQLGRVAEERRNFAAAGDWYRKSVAIKERLGDEHGAALTYHQLGVVACLRQDFAAAGDWYRKSVAIKERLGDEHGTAGTYHQLGMVACLRRDFAAAGDWYRKSAAISERLGDEQGAALTYHQLGMVACLRRGFAAAEGWYRKSVAIKERLGDEPGAAGTYHQLGMVACLRRDFAAAGDWYRKSVAIAERLGDERGAALIYHQLGVVAEARRDFAAAEDWYRKSVAISERLGDEQGAAGTYHQFGVVAYLRRDFAAAEDWYRKSVAISERLGGEHGAALTYHQLGVVAQERRDFDAAGGWVVRAIRIFLTFDDPHNAAIAIRTFLRIYRQLPETKRPAFDAAWKQIPGLPPLADVLAKLLLDS